MPQSKTVRYEDVVRAYQAEKGTQVVELKIIIPWAMDRGLLAGESDPVKYHIHQAGEALRRSKRPKVKSRNWHSITELVETTEGTCQKVLWAHIDDAPDGFLQTSIEQRFQQLKKDRESLDRDIDAIAERRPKLGRRLRQMVFRFDNNKQAVR